MSDIVLGMIIGGVIGVVGSAVVAWMQGHYSLKSRREENLARQQQQSTQIQHEKSSEVISRIIEIRSRYLNPLSDHLAELHAYIDDFNDKILSVTVSYSHQEYKIQVPEEDKQKLNNQLNKIKSTVSAIKNSRDKIYRATSKVTDNKLHGQLFRLIDKVFDFIGVYQEMYISLKDSTAGQDFIYDFEAILNPVTDTVVCIRDTNGHIESLLAGADIDGV